jgi:peptidyl-prolyl cis-trans isomerase C
MKNIVNISLVLVVLLSSAVFAAKPKKSAKSAAESKKPAAELKKAAVEPNKPVEEPNKPVVEPNSSADLSSVALAKEDANQSGAVAVTVNGAVITEGQIEAILNPHMEQKAGRIPENMVAQYRQQMRKRIIDQLAVEKILAQKEKQNNIDVNQSELDQQINKLVAQQNLTLDEFKALLKAYGTSFSDYQQNIRKRLMFEKLMDIEFAQKLQKSTDEQAKAYYDENIQQYSEPEKIHAKHILIRPAEDSNDLNGAKTRAKAKAQELLERIKAGESFEELAKQYSACPSAKDGGDLGMQPKDTFVPEFEKAAFALKPGQVSGVVQTSFGYHIIKLIEHVDANTVSFSQAKDQILEALANKQKEQIVVDYIQKIKAQADIKYVNEADKLEPQISGTKSGPMRRQTENVQPSDEKKPAPKDTGEPKKD